ncbi:hypothetical protein [Aquisphaera insulae]|uniref:hypothetical protein n=1 Tax=Aquisphaera insulae TaxID=2712864 RepID=UPI0013EC9194|nr:hypothetical protein [Aquisphaera insulae]
MPRSSRPHTAGRRRTRGLAGLLLASAFILTSIAGIASAQEPTAATEPVAPEYFAGRGEVPDAPRVEMSFLDAALESLFGDVYAPGRWRPLSLGTFFSEGWNEAWAGGPAGRNGTTPRHGWLGAFDGVFYRLWFTNFTYNHHLNTSYRGDGYFGDYVLFLPFSRRFEVAFDVPFVAANGTSSPFQGYTRNFGDFTVIPRFLLSESEATTQTFAFFVRTPTGSALNGNHVMSLSPRYEFWTNPGGSWVVRGGAGPVIPLNQHENPGGPQTSFTGDLAVGRYFRPHDVPFGDLVFYVAGNFNVPMQGTSKTTYAGIGPGTRFHIMNNYFFMNFWEFPVTAAHPEDFNMQTAILKVF